MRLLIFILIILVGGAMMLSLSSSEDNNNTAYGHMTHGNTHPTISLDAPLYDFNDTVTLTCDPQTKQDIYSVHWYVDNKKSFNHPEFAGFSYTPSNNPSLEFSFVGNNTSTLLDYEGEYRASCDVITSGKTSHGFIGIWNTFFVTAPEGYEVVLSAIDDDPPEGNDNYTSATSDDDTNGGKDSCNDCTPPTIGLDSNGKRFVDYGLTLNDKSFQADYFKTVMPQQYTEIGKENHLIIKVYENSGAYNIDHMRFGMVKEIGSPLNTFEPRLEIDIKNTAHDIMNPELESVILVDKNNIINEYRVDVSLVSCMDGYTHQCLQLDIYWKFDKIPNHNVLAINGWDNDNNSFTTYFNHGLVTIDPNYIKPETIPPYKYECKDPQLDTIKNGGDRNNCHWRALYMGWLWK